MKVLLKEDVEHLGYAGEVFTVAAGYGRNYLIPRGLAESASSASMKRASIWRERAEARREQVKAEYDALSAKVVLASLEFERKAGENGRLYGSVTMIEIADALAAQLGIEVDRRKLEGDALRQVGESKIGLRLDKDHIPQFSVTVTREGGDIVVEEAAEVEIPSEDEQEDDFDYPFEEVGDWDIS